MFGQVSCNRSIQMCFAVVLMQCLHDTMYMSMSMLCVYLESAQRSITEPFSEPLGLSNLKKYNI